MHYDRPMSNTKSTKLQPMAIRVTPRQFALLQALKSEDGISVQDHIRRALDNYLRRAPDPAAAPVSASIAALEPHAPPPPPPQAELPGQISRGTDPADRQKVRQPAPIFGEPEPIDQPTPARVQSKRQQVVYR